MAPQNALDQVPLCVNPVGTLTGANPWDEQQLAAARGLGYDLALLPLHADVLKWLRDEQTTGRRIVLLSEGDPLLARALANHLQIAAEVATIASGAGSSRARSACR